MKNMDLELKIRPASKEDAELIAKVVAAAINTEEGYALLPIFRELAEMENSQYSYKNTLVAEVCGEPVGAVVGYDGAKLHELRLSLLKLYRERVGKNLEIEDETSAGEFYVDSISVLPEFRGRGIGEQLLKSMIEKATEEGHSCIGLLVDFDNPKAEKLYRKIGFHRKNETMFLGHKMWHLQLTKD